MHSKLLGSPGTDKNDKKGSHNCKTEFGTKLPKKMQVYFSLTKGTRLVSYQQWERWDVIPCYTYNIINSFTKRHLTMLHLPHSSSAHINPTNLSRTQQICPQHRLLCPSVQTRAQGNVFLCSNCFLLFVCFSTCTQQEQYKLGRLKILQY